MPIEPDPTWPYPLPGTGRDAVTHLTSPPPPGAFRAYDVRGRTAGPFDHDPTLLTPFGANVLGRAFGTLLAERRITQVVVGHDSRAYAPVLAGGLVEGLLSTGREVVVLGLATTPMVYFAQHHLGVDAGVAVTASHNPNGWAGFKLSDAPSTSFGPAEIAELHERAQSGRFMRGRGTYTEHSVTQAYVDRLAATTPAERPLRIVIDGGNSIAGPVATAAFEAAGHQVLPCNLELDWSFPNHEPDPELLEARTQLAAAVRSHGADLGVALDGDGDRLGVTDEQGATVYADRLVALLARDVLTRHPGASIVYDVKCSRLVEDVVLAAGGVPVMGPTGHSHIKRRMRELGAPFAGERSGHLFDAADHLGFDDAVHAGLRTAHVLATAGTSMSDLVAGLPQYRSSPTMQAACPDEVKDRVVAELAEAILARTEPARVVRVDGLRAEFDDGWLLVRASTNLPGLVLLCEGRDEPALERLYALLREVLDERDEVDRVWQNDLRTAAGIGGAD
ncbi:MAG: phosphomannomutase/phosphoglucomutase [Nitriliruptoraceae bacterium]